jgi:hypothetical protein
MSARNFKNSFKPTSPLVYNIIATNRPPITSPKPLDNPYHQIESYTRMPAKTTRTRTNTVTDVRKNLSLLTSTPVMDSMDSISYRGGADRSRFLFFGLFPTPSPIAPLHIQPSHHLKTLPIHRIEPPNQRAIRIQLPDQPRPLHQRHYNLRPRRGTGIVTRKLVHIRHHHRLATLGRPAHTPFPRCHPHYVSFPWNGPTSAPFGAHLPAAFLDSRILEF